MFDIFLEDSSEQKWEHVFMSVNNFLNMPVVLSSRFSLNEITKIK